MGYSDKTVAKGCLNPNLESGSQWRVLGGVESVGSVEGVPRSFQFGVYYNCSFLFWIVGVKGVLSL